MIKKNSLLAICITGTETAPKLSLVKEVHDLYEVLSCQVKEQCDTCLVQVIAEPVTIVP